MGFIQFEQFNDTTRRKILIRPEDVREITEQQYFRHPPQATVGRLTGAFLEDPFAPPAGAAGGAAGAEIYSILTTAQNRQYSVVGNAEEVSNKVKAAETVTQATTRTNNFREAMR